VLLYLFKLWLSGRYKALNYFNKSCRTTFSTVPRWNMVKFP